MGHPLGKTSRWQRRRAAQLAESPWCAFCLERGEVVPATVADHVVPHRGDVNLFWCGELQSLCKRCHDTTKSRTERRGYDPTIGPDGMPIDKARHPAFTGRLPGPIKPAADAGHDAVNEWLRSLGADVEPTAPPIVETTSPKQPAKFQPAPENDQDLDDHDDDGLRRPIMRNQR